MSNNNKSAKEAIKAYLDNRAATDKLFAVSYKKEGKNLDECFRYIMGEARKRGNSVCMTDEEVFGLAVHYYDEDDIKIVPIRGASSVSRTAARVELTEEEKAKAKSEAIEEYKRTILIEETMKHDQRTSPRKERKKSTAKEPIHEAFITPSLFDSL